MEALQSAELALLEQLGALLDRAPASLYDALIGPPEHPSQVSTRIEDGRFTHLSLRCLGQTLRWAHPVGELSLDFSALKHLEALDLTGLHLTTLDLSGNPALRRLEARENELHHLDLSTNPALQILDLAANELMILDLRNQPVLWFLDASGNELSALLVPEKNHLKTVRCTRNQLMLLDLGDSPHLRELDASRNALVSLTLRAPDLRSLDMQDNQLSELDVAQLPALRKLWVRSNRLASLGLSGTTQLRELYASRNYLDTLDLTDLIALEQVDLARNQLQGVLLGASPALATLDVQKNRLPDLDLRGVPCLQRLDVSHNRLASLELQHAPALCELRASHNHLQGLNLENNAHLARVEVQNNPLQAVSLPPSPTLAHLLLDEPDLVQTTPQQRAQLLGPAPPSGDLATMDRFERHHFAATYDGEDREVVLLKLVSETERCALGTAVMVYWMTTPHYYLQFEDRSDVPAYAIAGWDLIEAIEDRVRAGAYVHDDIFFDPKNDQQTVDVIGRDWTRSSTLPQRPPAFMTHPRGLQR